MCIYIVPGLVGDLAVSKFMCVSGVSSQVEQKFEQLADLLHPTLPPTHTTQQLQQLLESFIRCVYAGLLFMYIDGCFLFKCNG